MHPRRKQAVIVVKDRGNLLHMILRSTGIWSGYQKFPIFQSSKKNNHWLFTTLQGSNQGLYKHTHA